MKRKMFIGSSKESIEIAKQIKEAIDKRCSDWLDISLWSDSGIFELNVSTLECLVKKSRICDYGVFVAAADDCVLKRRKINKAARDNVIFELGLFMGSLGLDRAFVVTSVKLPSDMEGVTKIYFEKGSISNDILEQLVSKIEEKKTSYRLGHRQSTALAIGYFNNYVKPSIDKLAQSNTSFSFNILVPDNISDLHNRISKYESENESISVDLMEHNRQIHKLKSGNEEYWDIPRLLRTLEDLLSFYEPHKEPGVNPAYDELLAIELSNFCNVLQELNKSQNTYHENLHIFRI